jgi:DNA modification methylase
MTSKQNTNSQPIELQFHVEPDAWLPVSELLTMFHPANSQTRNRAELDAIKRHLSDEGFTAEMIVVNPINRKIVSGHGRTQAAHELGYTGTLPVVYREYTTDAEHRRAMLRWNLARGHQDEAKEAAEFAALLAEFDRADLAADFGMVEGEFEALLKEFAPPTPLEDPGAQTDRAEELRQVWGVELGQMWQLGAHRLICGDCTDAAVVGRVMGGERANGAFTSPPYAMQRKDTYGGTPTDEYVDWWEGVQAAVRSVLAEDGSFFVNIKPHCEDGERVLYVFDLVLAMRRRWGWKYVDELCWRNTKNGVPGTWPNRLKNAFEPVYHFSTSEQICFLPKQAGEDSEGVFSYHPLNQDSTTGTPFTGAYKHLGYKHGVALPSNVLEIPAEGGGLHSAPFPVALPSFFIKAYSATGDIWIEPFSGSGTTLIACEQLSRKCRAVEISPAYVAVALQRWADMTGQTPELLP